MPHPRGSARLLGVSVCLGPALVLSSPSASATTTTVSCSEIQTGIVSCAMPDGLSEYALAQLLTDAQALTQTSLTTATPVVITAYGGAGRYGSNGGGLYQGGDGGFGGKAQTVTSIADYTTAYGSDLHYYVGKWGATASGGRGGASTLVSGVDLTTTLPCIAGYSTCTTTNLLLDAGGGGGGGEGNADGDGGAGGNGGTAVSGQIISAGAAGKSGQSTSGTVRTAAGGGGGQNGDGGSGGRAGAGVDGIRGTDGQDGIGGLGGPTHTSNGPNAGASWTNNTSLALSNAGQGGEGEFRTNGTNYGSGGGGGGGWGGGGGGGGGGEAVSGGGGGGGGSFAVGNTATVESLPNISNGNAGFDGAVYVTFVGTGS
ncbi:hypothetical protein AB0N09_07320 [Streptomyces erythrochromogenes]|uniref:hypothetical protein n=1 Tax=Streptomyces erythrochromogenes TaxID=285574 RepID=UPI003444332F